MTRGPLGDLQRGLRASAIVACVIAAENVVIELLPGDIALRRLLLLERNREGVTGRADTDHRLTALYELADHVELRLRQHPAPDTDQQDVRVVEHVKAGDVIAVLVTAEDQADTEALA